MTICYPMFESMFQKASNIFAEAFLLLMSILLYLSQNASDPSTSKTLFLTLLFMFLPLLPILTATSNLLTHFRKSSQPKLNKIRAQRPNPTATADSLEGDKAEGSKNPQKNPFSAIFEEDKEDKYVTMYEKMPHKDTHQGVMQAIGAVHDKVFKEVPDKKKLDKLTSILHDEKNPPENTGEEATQDDKSARDTHILETERNILEKDLSDDDTQSVTDGMQGMVSQVKDAPIALQNTKRLPKSNSMNLSRNEAVSREETKTEDLSSPQKLREDMTPRETTLDNNFSDTLEQSQMERTLTGLKLIPAPKKEPEPEEDSS